MLAFSSNNSNSKLRPILTSGLVQANIYIWFSHLLPFLFLQTWISLYQESALSSIESSVLFFFLTQFWSIYPTVIHTLLFACLSISKIFWVPVGVSHHLVLTLLPLEVLGYPFQCRKYTINESIDFGVIKRWFCLLPPVGILYDLGQIIF